MHMAMPSRFINFYDNGLLLVLFIVLKLQGAISWSWFWVILPLWAPLAMGVSLFLAFSIAHISAIVFDPMKRRF